MSIKSTIQTLILILIIIIIGGVYFKYFDTKDNIVEELNLSNTKNKEKLEEMERKISDLEIKNIELNKKIQKEKTKLNTNKEIEQNNENSEISKKNYEQVNQENNKISEVTKNIEISNQSNEKAKLMSDEKNSWKSDETKNLVKDIEYISVDQKGNRFYLLATSGKSDANNSDILNLKNVRGKITSDIRDTIYIVSDFARYNSVSLDSKFYENVILNYQDKQIDCVNFDINMETNKAIAYNDVIITDPKSIIKAGMVEFDLKTKDINILPESSLENIKVVTN